MKKLLYWLIIVPLLASILLPATPVRAQSTEILRPNAVGSNVKWDPFGATEHWECVDEVTSDNDTTYVYTDANNEHDSYNLQDTTGSGTITNVRVYARAKSLTAGKDFEIEVIIAGTSYPGATKTLTDAYVDYYDDWEQNPNTLVDWTWADIDALEACVKSLLAGKVEYRVTTVWVVVTYAILPDISNTPDSFAFGVVSESSTPETGLTHFEVTNNSGFAVKITIGGTDMIGGVTWTLSDTATPGEDTYGLMAGLAGTSYNVTVMKTGPYNTLISGLADSSSQQWGLQLLAPTAFTSGGLVSGNVTLTATQP